MGGEILHDPHLYTGQGGILLEHPSFLLQQSHIGLSPDESLKLQALQALCRLSLVARMCEGETMYVGSHYTIYFVYMFNLTIEVCRHFNEYQCVNKYQT